jgi:hypothetical protein
MICRFVFSHPRYVIRRDGRSPSRPISPGPNSRSEVSLLHETHITRSRVGKRQVQRVYRIVPLVTPVSRTSGGPLDDFEAYVGAEGIEHGAPERIHEGRPDAVLGEHREIREVKDAVNDEA